MFTHAYPNANLLGIFPLAGGGHRISPQSLHLLVVVLGQVGYTLPATLDLEGGALPACLKLLMLNQGPFDVNAAAVALGRRHIDVGDDGYLGASGGQWVVAPALPGTEALRKQEPSLALLGRLDIQPETGNSSCSYHEYIRSTYAFSCQSIVVKLG